MGIGDKSVSGERPLEGFVRDLQILPYMTFSDAV